MSSVLAVNALIFLGTLENRQQKQKTIQTKGSQALVEVVNSQILVFEIDHNSTPCAISELISGGYLKEGQNICQGGKEIVIVNGQAKEK